MGNWFSYITPDLYFTDREANLLNSCISWTGLSFS